MIKIERSHNIADVERLLRQVRSTSGDTDLLLSTRLGNFQFGGRTALIQAIITWAKKNPHGRLITHISDISQADKQLRNLSASDHGIVALLSASDVMFRDCKTSTYAMALRLALERLAQMSESVQTAKSGPEVFFLCADETSKAYLPALYHQTDSPVVKGLNDFQLLVDEILHATIPFVRARPLPRNRRQDLAIVLRELFVNTHEWARTDLNNNIIDKSLRGLQSYLYHSLHRDDVLEVVRGCAPLERYLRHSRFFSSDNRQLFLETSIFDSGPGLSQRWTSIPLGHLTLDQEYNAVLKCLQKHSTTSEETHKGIGLHRVLQMLTLMGGFIRVRTGSLSLYRDFVMHPYEGKGDGSLDEPYLLDWESGSTAIEPQEPVQGALMTMFLPVFLD
jgi:hypothetical protein